MPAPCIIKNPDVFNEAEQQPIPEEEEEINIPGVQQDQEGDTLQADTSNSILPPGKTQHSFINTKKTPSREPNVLSRPDFSLSSAPEKHEQYIPLSQENVCEKFSCLAERRIYDVIHFFQEHVKNILDKIKLFFAAFLEYFYKNS